MRKDNWYMLGAAVFALIMAFGIFVGVGALSKAVKPDPEPTPTVENNLVIILPTPTPAVTTAPEPTPEPTPEVIAVYNIPLSADLQTYIFGLCEERSIDPTIILGMIKKESMYQADVIGDNGNSFGLMQIQPRWHEARMEKLGVTNLLDPYQNVLVGIDLFDELMDRGRGVEWALMAYNGGTSYANNMAAAGKVSDYAVTVMQYSRDLGA